jgi:hypothetical protein
VQRHKERSVAVAALCACWWAVILCQLRRRRPGSVRPSATTARRPCARPRRVRRRARRRESSKIGKTERLPSCLEFSLHAHSSFHMIELHADTVLEFSTVCKGRAPPQVTELAESFFPR